MTKNYAKPLTKEFIKQHYQIYFDESLNEFRSTKDNLITKKFLGNKYYILSVYDTDLKKQIQVSFHRLKYGWYHSIPEGAVVKHINGCLLDNRLSNLELTYMHNVVGKAKPCCNVKPLPKNANPSPEKYINKLQMYIARYKLEKLRGDKYAAHKTLSNIKEQKSKLLNYISEEEYEVLYQKFNESRI